MSLHGSLHLGLTSPLSTDEDIVEEYNDYSPDFWQIIFLGFTRVLLITFTISLLYFFGMCLKEMIWSLAKRAKQWDRKNINKRSNSICPATVMPEIKIHKVQDVYQKRSGSDDW